MSTTSFSPTICPYQLLLMIRLLLENKTAAEAASKIQALKAQLKALRFNFGDIAPLLLTDNGGEFSIVVSAQ